MQRKNTGYLGFLILTAFCLSNAQASANWPNEPPGSVVLSDWSFDEVTGGGWSLKWGGGGRIVSDATAKLSPPNVLRNTRDATANYGSDVLCRIPEGYKDEIYLGYWFKPSSPHCGWFCWYQKLSLVNYAGAAHTHFYTKMQEIDETNGMYNLIVTVEGFDNSHLSGGSTFWGNISNPRFRVNEWRQFELYIKRSTTGTSRDGVVKFWVDGQPVGSVTGVNFGANLDNVMLCNIWDSIESALPFSEWVQYDHVRVSLPHVFDPAKPDTAAPKVEKQYPAPNQAGFPAKAPITLNVTDDRGIDSSSIILSINGQRVTPAVSGYVMDYKLSYSPLVELPAQVIVSVEARDLAGNQMPKATYSFSTTGTGIRQKSIGTLANSMHLQIIANSVRFNLPQRDGMLTVHNLAGKKLYSCRTGGPSGEIDLPKLGNGVFVATLSASGSRQSCFFRVMK